MPTDGSPFVFWRRPSTPEWWTVGRPQFNTTSRPWAPWITETCWWVFTTRNESEFDIRGQIYFVIELKSVFYMTITFCKFKLFKSSKNVTISITYCPGVPLGRSKSATGLLCVQPQKWETSPIKLDNYIRYMQARCAPALFQHSRVQGGVIWIALLFTVHCCFCVVFIYSYVLLNINNDWFLVWNVYILLVFLFFPVSHIFFISKL